MPEWHGGVARCERRSNSLATPGICAPTSKRRFVANVGEYLERLSIEVRPMNWALPERSERLRNTLAPKHRQFLISVTSSTSRDFCTFTYVSTYVAKAARPHRGRYPPTIGQGPSDWARGDRGGQVLLTQTPKRLPPLVHLRKTHPRGPTSRGIGRASLGPPHPTIDHAGTSLGPWWAIATRPFANFSKKRKGSDRKLLATIVAKSRLFAPLPIVGVSAPRP
jgi:hypothetical protein